MSLVKNTFVKLLTKIRKINQKIFAIVKIHAIDF